MAPALQNEMKESMAVVQRMAVGRILEPFFNGTEALSIEDPKTYNASGEKTSWAHEKEKAVLRGA
jgi:hypothetical protein